MVMIVCIRMVISADTDENDDDVDCNDEDGNPVDQDNGTSYDNNL